MRLTVWKKESGGGVLNSREAKMGRRVRCLTARGGFAVTASRQRLSIAETKEQRRRGGARRRSATAQAERWSRVVARRRNGGVVASDTTGRAVGNLECFVFLIVA
ncbi:hypothetical protein U1Q18_034134 [Sarracenia purpurea var. burkii]